MISLDMDVNKTNYYNETNNSNAYCCGKKISKITIADSVFYSLGLICLGGLGFVTDYCYRDTQPCNLNRNLPSTTVGDISGTSCGVLGVAMGVRGLYLLHKAFAK